MQEAMECFDGSRHPLGLLDFCKYLSSHQENPFDM